MHQIQILAVSHFFEKKFEDDETCIARTILSVNILKFHYRNIFQSVHSREQWLGFDSSYGLDVLGTIWMPNQLHHVSTVLYLGKSILDSRPSYVGAGIS